MAMSAGPFAHETRVYLSCPGTKSKPTRPRHAETEASNESGFQSYAGRVRACHAVGEYQVVVIMHG